MYQKKRLSLAVSAALGLSALVLVPGQALAQDQDVDENLVMEEVVVTGSRIKRSTNTQSQEIISFTAEDMKIAGDISVADALRSSTMNSFGSYRESSGSSWQGNATIDLRGVGQSRTLVLLNGRRTVGGPSLDGGGTVNLNMIPFSAVDRIEVIADGASAIYGSDAVAGVVNVILKKDFNGMTVQARYGDRRQDDGTEESASMLMGVSGDRGSITFSLEYDKRDPIFDADRDYTAARWSDLNGDGVITGYSETVGVSYYGYTLNNPHWTPDTVFDPNDQLTWQYTPGANCQEGDGWAGVLSIDAVFGTNSGFYCGYAYAMVSANRAGLERVNNFVSAEYELTDSIDVFADVLVGLNESFGRYAPPAARGPTIPGDPRNDIGATQGRFRWVNIGTRDNVVNDSLVDINVGGRGDAFGGNITWEAYYTYSEYVSTSVGNYYLNYAGLDYNINNGIEDFDTFIANMKHTTIDDNRQKLEKLFAGMQFDLFEMKGGTAAAYVAAEYFEIDYAALVDGQSEAGLVGGSSGNSAEGYRDVSAISAEAILPVTDWMEIDLAVRYDDYSDFGSATSPRIGGIFTIPGVEDLTFKASWGEGFRAPNLSSLYGATAFSAEDAKDYYGCQLNGISETDCPERQFDTYIGSNPDLDAESSETYSLGVEWRFADRWMTSLNYFHLEIEDSINYTSTQDQLDVDFQTQGGNPNVTRDAQGGVLEVAAGFQNGAVPFTYESLDFSLSGGFDTNFGDFGFQTNASHYLDYDRERSYGTGDIYNAAGTLEYPDWRANMLLTWNLGDIFASVNWDYIGSQKSHISDEKWDSWNVFNAQIGYAFGKYGTVSVGANNLLDEDPILDSVVGEPVDEDQYDQTGRVVYIRYRIDM